MSVSLGGKVKNTKLYPECKSIPSLFTDRLC